MFYLIPDKTIFWVRCFHELFLTYSLYMLKLDQWHILYVYKSYVSQLKLNYWTSRCSTTLLSMMRRLQLTYSTCLYVIFADFSYDSYGSPDAAIAHFFPPNLYHLVMVCLTRDSAKGFCHFRDPAIFPERFSACQGLDPFSFDSQYTNWENVGLVTPQSQIYHKQTISS